MNHSSKAYALWDALLTDLETAHSGNDAQALLWLRERTKDYADSHSSELLGAERPVPADSGEIGISAMGVIRSSLESYASDGAWYTLSVDLRYRGNDWDISDLKIMKSHQTAERHPF